MDREERIARNDAIFRSANEELRRSADELDIEGMLPFLCECGEPTCTTVTQLTRGEYEAVRAGPRHFLNVPGHEVVAKGIARVVARHDRYVVVEKTGKAGDIADELDTRGRSAE